MTQIWAVLPSFFIVPSDHGLLSGDQMHPDNCPVFTVWSNRGKI